MIKKILLLLTFFFGVALFAETAYDRGIKAYQSQQYTEALKYFYVSARQQNVNAFVELGIIHQYGIGTGKNPYTAFYWYEKAAQHNHPKAQYYLGHLYEVGLGTEKDSKQASEWYRRASANGSQEAKDRLAGKEVIEQVPVVKEEVSLTGKLAFWKTTETKPTTNTPDENHSSEHPLQENASTQPTLEQNVSNEENKSLADKLIFWK